MKKWLIVAACLLLVGGVALTLTYRMLLSRDFLVARIESAIDSRVQIGSYGVSLFSVPARVVLRDVIIAERDESVCRKAHDQRKPLKTGEIRVKEIRFDVSLGELLGKRIKASELRLRGAHFDMRLNEEGEFNLARRFAAPPDKRREEESDEGLNARDSSAMVTELQRLLIEDASFDLVVEKTGLEIEGRDLRLELSDIKVDPGALEKVNEAHLEFTVQLAIHSSRQGRLQYGQIGLEGPARVRLFEPVTGRLAPDAEIEFAMDRDSYLSARAPYLIRLWQVTEVLTKVGLTTKPLPEQLGFGRDRVLSASWADGRLDLRRPLSLVMEDWELMLGGDSWAHFGNEQHASAVSLVSSAKVSDFVSRHLSKLVEVAPERLRPQLHQQLCEPLFVGERLTLAVSTEGPLSDPRVKLQTLMPEIRKVLTDSAKAGLRNLLIDQLSR